MAAVSHHQRKHSAKSPPLLTNPPLKRQKLDDSLSPSASGLNADVELGHASSGSNDSSDAFSTLKIEEADEGGGWATMMKNGKGKAKAVAVGDEDAAADSATDGGAKRKAKAKLKKQQKALQQAIDQPAEFHYDTRGFKNRTIKLADVRDLLLHINADERAPNWMLIKNKRSIFKTVAIMIPGITPPALGVEAPSGSSLPFSIASASAGIPAMQTLFSHAMPTKAAGDRFKMHSCMQTFMSSPMSQSAKARRDEERKKLTISPEARDPTTYLVPSELMLEQGYPPTSYPFPATAATRQLARKERSGVANNGVDPTSRPPFPEWRQLPDGWIQTPAPQSGVSGNDLKILGVDCEMCLAQSGSVLARVSVVDASGVPIYDSLVQPSEPIVDYVTRFSGITAERLEGVKTTLEDVQRRLGELIDFDTVLVGHSLECDLKVLKLAHPWVIDTSVIYQHPKGPPFKPSLKWLAEKWLNKRIQVQRPVAAEGGESLVVGHDSEEDARAAVELLQKKLEKGPGFGEFVNDSEAIFDRMARGTDPKVAAVVDYGTGGQWMAGRARTSVGFKYDSEVVDGIVGCLDEHDFVFGRCLDLSHALGWVSSPPRPEPSGESASAADSHAASSDHHEVSVAYAQLSTNLSKLHSSLPCGTALIVFTGHNDPREMGRLAQKKARFDRLFKSQPQSTITPEDRWMAEDERALVDAVEQCKLGLSFFCVK